MPETAAARPAHFADALILRVRELGHPLCVGIDPHLALLPPLFRRGSMAPGHPRTADAVQAYALALLERVVGRAAIVKPQIAFFEQLGWPGLRALTRVVEAARELGLLVLLDAKRGDIGSTAEGYVQAYLAADAPLACDAITLSPYLGRDTLAPFAAAARAHGRGMFVLAKTSNPGSGDLQDRELDGVPVYASVATGLAGMAEQLCGERTGWSSLGVVMGATYPEQALQVRRRLPRALFLVPGYGEQGASAADAVRGFVEGPQGLEGGVVNSSRAVGFPPDGDTSDATSWEKAIDAALERAAGELGDAVARRG